MIRRMAILAGLLLLPALLAAEAMGYAGIWRTGAPAFDREVMNALRLDADEEIIGFLYLGTAQGPRKPVPELLPDEFLTAW